MFLKWSLLIIIVLSSKGLSLFHCGNVSAKLVEIPPEWALRGLINCVHIDGIASLNHNSAE